MRPGLVEDSELFIRALGTQQSNHQGLEIAHHASPPAKQRVEMPRRVEMLGHAAHPQHPGCGHRAEGPASEAFRRPEE